MRLDQRGTDIALVAHGKGCQMDTGHPAFGFLFQSEGGRRIDLNAQSLFKECLCFRHRKAQILGSDLCHTALCTQTGNW